MATASEREDRPAASDFAAAEDREFTVVALDGHKRRLRGATFDAEGEFFVLRNAQGLIVYCTPQERVADVIVGESATPTQAGEPDGRQVPGSPTAATGGPTVLRAKQGDATTPGALPHLVGAALLAQAKQTPASASPQAPLKASPSESARAEVEGAKAKLAAAYLRTPAEGKNPGALQQIVAERAQQRGYTLVSIYTEQPSPNGADGFPALRRLLVDAREGLFSTVLVVAPASTAQEVAALSELSFLLNEHGLKMVLLTP